MEIRTSRFGTIEVVEERVLRLPEGLVGLPALTRFLLLDDETHSPFKWLQSIDEPSLAFVVIEPRWLVPGYEEGLPSALAGALGIERAEEMAVLALVSIPEDPHGMTANLKGPLVFNTKSRAGAQIILDDESLSLRHPILPAAAER